MRALGVATILVAAAFSAAAFAGLDETGDDGWHTWHVETESGAPVRFYVLVEDGAPVRIHSMNWNCYKPAGPEAHDHGAVPARASYEWFRAVVEDSSVDRQVRDAALFGLVESGDDEAFDYIDGILSRAP